MKTFQVNPNKKELSRPVVIVGAGITGCVIGYELAKRGKKVIIVERESRVGGLAKTFRYRNFSFDIGPHRFYTQKEEISAFIHSVLNGDFLTIHRNSGVYFLGRYYAWPLRPAILFNLPLHIIIKSIWELLLIVMRNRKKKLENFEDYILINYGPTLYNIFFKGYTRKFLGLPTKEIHFQWAKEAMKRAIIDERMASRNLLDILKLMLRFKPLETLFIYPSKGIGVFCERLTQELKEHGGEIITNSFIKDVRYSSGKIEELSFNGVKIKPDKVIWTASLKEICRLLNFPCKGLNYLSLLLYNIVVNGSPKRDFQWCYYGDRKVLFSRVTSPTLFSKDMGREGKFGLCVEVNSNENDPSWKNPETLVEQIKKDLVKVSLLDRISDIESIYVEKIADTYHIYTIDYPNALERVKGSLAKFKNLILAGRTGLFWYNNMDDCIENGLEVARNINQE